MSSITQKLLSLDLSDVRLIDVSERSTVSGQTLRVVRFFGDPIVSNAPTLLLQVNARSTSPEDLKIETPTFAF